MKNSAQGGWSLLELLIVLGILACVLTAMIRLSPRLGYAVTAATVIGFVSLTCYFYNKYKDRQ